MLLSLVTLALVSATPCNLSLLAPVAQVQAATPALLQQDPCNETLPQSPAQRPRWQRGTLTFLGSALGAVAGTVAGGLTGFAIGGRCSGECMFGPPGMWLGALIGYSLGAGLGAHFTGDALGGDGQWWSTLLGTAAGTALSLLLVSIAANDEGAAPALYAAPFLPSAGALLGYELGQRPASALPGCAQLPAPRGPLLSLRVAF